MGLLFILDEDPHDFIQGYKRQRQRRYKAALMRRVPGPEWPPLLQCKVCGATLYAETFIGRNGIPRLVRDALNDCPRGCSEQALRGLMLARRQTHADAKADQLKRRGGK